MSSILLAHLLLGVVSAAAQEPPTVPMTRPDAVVDEPFSLLRGARELPDGRVLVTDWIEARIAVVDFGKGAVSDRNRTGAGPAEFRLAGRLMPFRGDSTLLADAGNSRFAVLDGDGRIARTFRPADQAAQYAVSADASGRLYYTIPGWLARRELPADTVELAVYDPAAESARTVARVQGSRRPSSNHSAGPRVPYVLFAPQDTWAVTPGGRIAIVRNDGYAVEWLDGRNVVRGPRNATRRIEASARDRRDAVRAFVQSSPIGGRGDGGMTAASADMLTDEAVDEVVRNSEFATTLPAFRAGDIIADAADRVWLGSWTSGAAPRRYDVFDARGRRIATVELAPDRHLLAVGRAHAYVVHTDGDGLQRLERHPVPAALR
jgi:hypothetical protein